MAGVTDRKSSDFSTDIEAVERIAAVPNILEVVCRTTGMGFAAVARVTPDRWVACAVRDDIGFGLKPGGELKVETTICHEIRQSGEGVIFDHASRNPLYAGHHTPVMYGLESYISLPIILPDGRFFGTLCAIDPNPAKVETPAVIDMFKLFAELIAFHLDAHERLAVSAASLSDERRVSKLREQFIAVLGHDLRNPLFAIEAGATLLAKSTLDERARGLVAGMKASAARMGGLIDDVLDFARGRLGGGLAIDRAPVDPGPTLRQVVDELRIGEPDGRIEADIAVDGLVQADAARLGQLTSNLLANALTHGAPGAPVRITAWSGDGALELSVFNSGPVIPPAVLAELFQPFERGADAPSRQGLGLGLYIASEIARAHGGTLEAESSEAGTRFTFRMPGRVAS